MSRWQSEALTLRVQQDKLELFRDVNSGSELLASNASLIADNGVCDPASLALVLDGIKSRSHLKITIDDGLARFWQASAPQNASRISDLEAAAWMRFESLFGERTHNLQLAADWKLNEPFLACALPAALLESIASCLNAPQFRHIRVDGCTPALIRVWNEGAAALPDSGCLVVENGATLTIVLFEHKRIIALKSVARAASLAASLEYADREIANLALQNGKAAPTTALLSLMAAGASFPGMQTRNLVWNTLLPAESGAMALS